MFGGKASDIDSGETAFCRLDKNHSSMLAENQSIRGAAGSLPLIFHTGVISHGLRTATNSAADTAALNSVSLLNI